MNYLCFRQNVSLTAYLHTSVCIIYARRGKSRKMKIRKLILTPPRGEHRLIINSCPLHYSRSARRASITGITLSCESSSKLFSHRSRFSFFPRRYFQQFLKLFRMLACVLVTLISFLIFLTRCVFFRLGFLVTLDFFLGCRVLARLSTAPARARAPFCFRPFTRCTST